MYEIESSGVQIAMAQSQKLLDSERKKKPLKKSLRLAFFLQAIQCETHIGIRKTYLKTRTIHNRQVHFGVFSKPKKYHGCRFRNEMNNAAPVPTSSEMRNIVKSMRNYIDAESNGEMNNKMDDFKQFVDNLMLNKLEKYN
ncbi:hypothetical protein TNCV_334941 [Trichonephila clavipes]|nr:hypothetical protein TNCV_334941 [Trichonephila clavipes]